MLICCPWTSPSCAVRCSGVVVCGPAACFIWSAFSMFFWRSLLPPPLSPPLRKKPVSLSRKVMSEAPSGGCRSFLGAREDVLLGPPRRGGGVAPGRDLRPLDDGL